MNLRRAVRHEEEQDPFLETIDRGIEFVRERAVPLLFTGFALLILILVGVWYVESRTGNRVDAYVEMYDALSDFESALQASPDARVTELDKVISQLDRVEAQGYVSRARFVQARAALAKGDAEGAARRFKEIAVAENGLVGLFAQLGYGAALEDQEDWNGAMQAYSDQALQPFADVPGYSYAWSEAVFGRARAARKLGQPTQARAAYEAILERYRANRDQALQDRKNELIEKGQRFLTSVEATSSAQDIDALLHAIDGWIQATLQKPEAERQRLADAIRLEGQIEAYAKSLVDAKKAEADGREDSALYAYQSALGDHFIAPTREQYQRAQFEIARLDEAGK